MKLTLTSETIWLIALALSGAGCPPDQPDGGLPSCDELRCQGTSICIDGACRARACLDLDCGAGSVCQGGPLCLRESEVDGPVCASLTCPEGSACQSGARCRPAEEDLDGDGVPSQLDCDDGDADRFPGNPEVCDGLDDDCNGSTDDAEDLCPEGERCCGEGGCVDTEVDRDHCGTCGQPCGLYEECSAGRCATAPAPVIEAVSPAPLPTGQWLGPGEEELPLVIRGSHLLGYATAHVEPQSAGVEGQSFEVITAFDGLAYTIDQPLLLDGALIPGGPATLRVVRNDGEESEPFPVTILGAAPPQITSVSPDPFPLADESVFSVYGSGFWGAPSLEIAPGETPEEWIALPVLWVTDTWVRTGTISLDPTEHTAGTWSARVRNPDGAESEPFLFAVDPAPAPTVSAISPAEAPLGTELSLEIFGLNYFGAPSVLLAPVGAPEEVLPALPLDLVDRRRLVTAPFELDVLLFNPGPYDLWVVNPDSTASNVVRFTVLE